MTQDNWHRVGTTPEVVLVTYETPQKIRVVRCSFTQDQDAWFVVESVYNRAGIGDGEVPLATPGIWAGLADFEKAAAKMTAGVLAPGYKFAKVQNMKLRDLISLLGVPPEALLPSDLHSPLF